MARFRGSIIGSRGEASRLGHPNTGLTVRANGWNAGVQVEATAKGEEDIFRIYVTGGSNAASPARLIAVIEGGRVRIVTEGEGGEV